MSITSNALINETSPYLLQHAYNPVQWYPWGESALTLAKQNDKPILLSIGYSACHWCHVMAHESFEDVEIAELMNELFINIKVDREERPDLDKIYQMAHQLLNQRVGGWPLTMFLTPDSHYPFFGGTYFPSQPRHGMPAFPEILEKIAAFYHQERAQIEGQNRVLANVLRHHETRNDEEKVYPINVEPLNLARQELAQQFDRKYGGFGQAPKFPHLTNIERLCHHYYKTLISDEPDQAGLQMALLTLKKMALGGIYDQLGGGFCRYSVDDEWMIPHFEKMLYDNGPFLSSYSEAWQLVSTIALDPELAELFKRTAIDTAQWVLREMQSPEGGFYSSLDADSQGQEGKFYVWSQDQLKQLNELYPLIAYHFGLNRPANFEDHWHLYVYHERKKAAKHFHLSPAEANKRIDQARVTLLQWRETRVRPGRDEKILTAWNALMIKGLAIAGRIFQRNEYLDAAEKALDFIKQRLWVDGRLLATYKGGKAHLMAYLDDYAFLIEAILTLLQARWREGELEFAIELAEVLLAEFADVEQGGFYFTGHHHETLISRPKSFADESLPSGNGVAALVLGRLGYLLGDTRYLTTAEQTIQAAWSTIKEYPSVHNTMLLALEDYLFPPEIIILRGELATISHWQTIYQTDYAPQRICFAIPSTITEKLPGLLAEKKVQEEAVAYVCQGTQCQAPIMDLASFKNLPTS
jgi:uncharacterized protein YyaL (SSP411 family)